MITASAMVDANTRRLTLGPPGDWASHDGRCEVVNTTYGWADPITCAATSVIVTVELGTNRFVVRAHARDGSRSVDSAARSVIGPREQEWCGRVRCLRGANLVELTPTQRSVQYGPAGAGLGLLALAVLLHVGGRRRDRTGGTR